MSDVKDKLVTAENLKNAYNDNKRQITELKSDIDDVKELVNIDDSNLLNTVTVTLDTYVNKSGAESTNDSFCTYKMIDVSNYLGQKLYCNGDFSNTSHIACRAASFYKADGSYLSGVENVIEGGYVIPPVFAKYMTVSIAYTDRQKKTIPNNAYISINENGSDNFNLVITDDIRKEVKEVSEVRNLLDGKQIIPRYFINRNNSGDSDRFFTVKDVKVKKGVRYYIHCDGSCRSDTAHKDARFITEYDVDGNVLNVIQNVSNNYLCNTDNTDHIAITFFYLENYPIANTGFYYFSQYPLTENTRLLNDSDRVFVKNISDFEVFYEETRKATICFSFDDGVTQDSQIVEAFDEYGAKCGFALISSILQDSRISDYRELYNRGYSILCHSNNGENMGNETSLTESQLLEKMRDTKVGFEKFGIKIKGWVTPSSFMKSDYVPTLERFYDYGYTRYFGAYTDTSTTPYDDLSNSGYYLKRVHIGTTSIENLKLAVDKAIENNGLLSFYGHAYELDDNTLDIAKLKELLSYVKVKEHLLECHLYAPDEAMMYYFRPRHKDLLN